MRLSKLPSTKVLLKLEFDTEDQVLFQLFCIVALLLWFAVSVLICCLYCRVVIVYLYCSVVIIVLCFIIIGNLLIYLLDDTGTCCYLWLVVVFVGGGGDVFCLRIFFLFTVAVLQATLLIHYLWRMT